MAVQFANKEVAANYEAVFTKDKFITIQKVYWGRLSNITPDVAEKLIEIGDNQIRRKTNVAPAAADEI